jgi:hypothetical protein
MAWRDRPFGRNLPQIGKLGIELFCGEREQVFS